MVEDGWIETHGGSQFHLLAPRLEEINARDIAYALAGIGRYNGHFRRVGGRIYTVAEHSCHISDKIAEAVRDPSSPYYLADELDQLIAQLTGLCHDAAEAYIGDMTRPLKVKMTAFKDVEARIDAVIAQAFGTTFPLPPIVKEFDTRILVDERAQGMSLSNNKWATDELKPLGVTVQWWSTDDAEEQFTIRFKALRTAIAKLRAERETLVYPGSYDEHLANL